MIKTNFVNYINNKIFSQFDKNKLLYFIIFFSRKLNNTNYNNKINDKK